MERAVRYALSVAVAIGVTGFVYLFAPPPETSWLVLLGVAQVYGVGTALWIRYAELLRSTEGPSWVSGAFAGVTTFGSIALLNGSATEMTIGIAALGFGLASFGFAAGVGFEHGREASAEN
ncbi:hypothetical protein [Haladaptatus sp. ZSTT2]|uniref:hypothetical protein n=1 Tax=Haladaptatus sp. ZSTT2 TaxID=3120515 RepID=UPI00300E8FA4